MEALLKFKYGEDFIKMVGFQELGRPQDVMNPDTAPPYFQFSARAVIWMMPEDTESIT